MVFSCWSPCEKKKSTLSILQQLRVVISPGPFIAPFRFFLLKGQQCDLPAGALCESLRTRRWDSPPGTRSILTAIFSLWLPWLQAKLSMRSITSKWQSLQTPSLEVCDRVWATEAGGDGPCPTVQTSDCSRRVGNLSRHCLGLEKEAMSKFLPETHARFNLRRQVTV